MKIIKIGYALPDRKAHKLGLSGFDTTDKNSTRFILKKVDPFQSFQDQGGPFDVVIHKIWDIINEANKCKDDSCEDQIVKFVNKIEAEKCILIDSIQGSGILASRVDTLKAISNCLNELNDPLIRSTKQIIVSYPLSQEKLNALFKENNIEFPVIVKPIKGQASACRYEMTIFGGMNQLMKDYSPPCIIQKFINHGGVLFKIYTIGKRWYVFKRPSFKNLNGWKMDSIKFRTDEYNQIDKKSTHPLKEHLNFEEGLQEEKLYISSKDDSSTSEHHNVFQRIVKAVQNEIKCYLLGIDVIMDFETGIYYIIDINYMPSYRQLDGFITDLLEFIEELV